MYLISGMHRSGTSLVARLLFEAGGNLGDPATFYRADRWNPDGYYEQPEVQQINMRLINGCWGKLAYFKLPSTRTMMNRGARIGGDLKRVADRYRDKIVKETRFCLTLPVWLAHETTVDGILICLRDPVAVATSLRRRNWITRAHAYRLWLEHDQRLMQHAETIPVWFVNYHHLLNENTFEREMQHACRFFQLQTPGNILKQLQQKVVKRSLDNSTECKAHYPTNLQIFWEQLLEKHTRQFCDSVT